MNPTKNSGRLLGLLFLASAIAGGAGTAYRGLSGARENTSDFITNIINTTGQMNLAIYLDMLGSILVVGIAIFLYPFIKKYSERLAITYFGIAAINFTIITVSNIIHIALLSLSKDFAGVETSETAHFITLARMLYDGYYWTHFLMLLLYSIGGSVLFYFLFKTCLVPKWLPLWGLLASAIVFVGGALQMADISVSFLMFVQNGVFMLTFIVWLLVVGFRSLEVNTSTV